LGPSFGHFTTWLAVSCRQTYWALQDQRAGCRYLTCNEKS
jgi:hypothetical protein